MYNIINNLTYSLNNFSEYISKKETINQDNSKNQIFNATRELYELYSKKDVYDLVTIKDYNIIGTNETYDYKTDIYNFMAECLSNSAVLFFFPKSHLDILLKSEKMVFNSFVQLVEFRIKDIIWKLKKYISTFERELAHQKNKISKTKINNLIRNLKKDNIEKKIISRNEIYNGFNSNNNIFIAKNDSSKIKSLQRTKLIYNSKINLTNDIKIKNFKKIINRNMENIEVFHTERNNTKIKYNIYMNIPTILRSQNINRDESNIYNVSHSQTKRKNLDYVPKIFPYIVKDHNNKNYLFNKRNDNNDLIKPIKTIENGSILKLKKIFLNKK
jgi:hypothetical protein